MKFRHTSVLLREAVDALATERGGIFVDCTAGGGGHSYEIASRLRSGSRLVCLDRDSEAVIACRERLAPFGALATVVKSNYSDICCVLDTLGIDKIDGILWDLGVSSKQLDDGKRGFSYSIDAPLDMRMDASEAKTAFGVVNEYSEERLRSVIGGYGEEKFAGRIARAIIENREKKPIETTGALCAIVASAIPAKARHSEAQHPAKRTFQAIRIEVNDELSAIAPSIESAISRLNPGGTAAVITFHSLEDRIVKNTFSHLAHPCECPPDFPVCICGKTPSIELVTRKPVIPSPEEATANPRSRSAKLRVARKI